MNCKVVFCNNNFTIKHLNETVKILKGNENVSMSFTWEKNPLLSTEYQFVIVMIAGQSDGINQVCDRDGKLFDLNKIYNAPKGVKELEKIPKVYLMNCCQTSDARI